MDAAPAKIVYRFGVFDADPASGELRKSGVRIRLPDQPFQVLILLLEKPGQLVSREDIRQKLWPADTFVDFDHSLNTVVNKLREALGDSASSPRFVETLARRGYRFIAPVEVAGGVELRNGPHSSAAGAFSPEANASAIDTGPPSGFNYHINAALTRPEEVPAFPRRYVRVLFLLIQLMYLCFYVVSLARLPYIHQLLEGAAPRANWILVIVVITAAVGIPVRLYLMASIAFDVKGLAHKFQKIFPFTFPLDELWALSPFLLLTQIGLGLALAATAALIYVPFSQRTLLFMGGHHLQ